MNGEGFIDRSKVRILLCDNDARSSEHVFTLLINCSYQVTSVKSARQVIDALNAEGPDIDIILAEVDLPMAKGMKMLKYITRDKDLQRIPVIMMSAQDEVSIVVKCLRLGAADYLVKPLRTNELLNLWTHMWRRRHMLGLVEKSVIIYDLEVPGSDPSDANTTSTTIFSDDTDDKARKSVNPEIDMSNHHEETAAGPVAAVGSQPPIANILGCLPCVPGIGDRQTGQCSLGPKKSELRVGDSSSAFFTYVKSSTQQYYSHESVCFDKAAVQSPIKEYQVHACTEHESCKIPAHENRETPDKSSQVDDVPISNNHITDSQSKEEESSQAALHQRNAALHQRNEPHVDILNFHAHAHSSYQYYMHGMMNQVMIPSPASQIYQKNFHHGLQNHANSAMVAPYAHFPQHVPGIGSYPYYPVNMLQPGQVPSSHQWPSYVPTTPCPEVKVGSKVDKREAALMKFRQKRKERCFDKKIRYVNRKKLAERRPRVRGQFVRKNGVNVDLNGQPNSGDFDDDDEEDEDDVDQASRDSSPEDYA